jgi:hypothetical protein
MKFQDNAAIFNDGENTIRDADDNASLGGNGR